MFNNINDMKKIHLAINLFLVAMVAALAGCTKDSTTTPDTPVGRDSYIGSWSVSESYTKLTYEVTILADPNSNDGVLIAGFANTMPSGPRAGAVVSGSKITLDANQVIDGLKLNGGGTLSGTKITWVYTIDDGANLTHAVAVYTKK